MPRRSDGPCSSEEQTDAGSLAPHRLGIVIPVLDEAENLEALFDDLDRSSGVTLEVCVADGGSKDGSRDLARARGARVVQTPPGRGRQMNAGRETIASPWLLFLHADSRIPEPETLRRALDALRLHVCRHGSRVAGHFPICFRNTPPEQKLAFRFLERKTSLNRPHTINGDQGFLLPADFFDLLGGFDESLPFLEDQRFAERVRAEGRWITLPGDLTTSPRRFDREGFGRRYFVMAIIMAVWHAGVDEFFEIAPDLYRRHAETDRLDLEPVIDAIWQVMGEIGPRRTVEAWLDVGRFARENSWQIAYWVDTLLTENLDVEVETFTRWWDATLGQIDHWAVDAMVAAGAFVAVMWGLPAAFRIGD